MTVTDAEIHAMLEILDEGARKLGVKLLPDPQAPLDVLRAVYRDHEAGAPLNLDLTLAEFLKQEPVTHHFAVDLVLAIQINTRWRVAPKEDMTPKAILELGWKPRYTNLDEIIRTAWAWHRKRHQP